jgi:hypothetical protein
MQIINRLEKLEQKISVGAFCDCPDTQKIFYIDATSDGSDADFIPPEFCAACAKPIKSIVARLVDAD